MGLPPKQVSKSSVSELVKAWHASPEWSAMKPSTRSDWNRYGQRIVEAWGDLEVRGIMPKPVIALRDRYASAPAAANNLLRCLSAMMHWAVPRDWRSDNPCREVEKLQIGEGYQPWPLDVVASAREQLIAAGNDPLWWVLAFALYTGQRRGDVLAMRWDALQCDLITVRQEKTGKLLTIPLHRDLREIVATLPKRAVSILATEAGQPWSNERWKSAWRRQHPPAAARYVLHGLRKSVVVTLLEAGCTTAEVAPITGQSHDMVEHYAKRVNQKKLARAAMTRWEGSQ